MPEVPELEILKRELKREVVGRYISKVYTGSPTLFSPSSIALKDYLTGKEIKDVSRYGKFLVFLFNNRYNIGIHFGMGGLLLYVDNTKRKNYDFFIEFQNGKGLLFRDIRYGKITLFKKDELYRELGPDVMNEELFTEEYLKAILREKNRYIKSVLMDQKLISGLGNTYTDEILYRAKIHPKRKAKTLEEKEISRLYKYIREVVNEAIALGGNSEDGFLDIYGKKGKVQENLIVVHHRMGNSCPICGAKIEKIKLGGRDTYFCPVCQI